MVSPRYSCDQNRLRLALADQLGEDAQEALVTHLEHCDDCRNQLEALAAGRDWWRKAESHLSGETRETEPTATARCDQPWLGFLVPSDDERYLGRLGAYQVTEVIGSGGFGVVLKAFDAALNRHVAIKVLSPQ